MIVAFVAPQGEPEMLPDALFIVIDVKFVQSLKALLPIVVTLLGIVILVIDVQLLKALLPISAKLDGNVGEGKLEQLVKA